MASRHSKYAVVYIALRRFDVVFTEARAVVPGPFAPVSSGKRSASPSRAIEYSKDS